MNYTDALQANWDDDFPGLIRKHILVDCYDDYRVLPSIVLKGVDCIIELERLKDDLVRFFQEASTGKLNYEIQKLEELVFGSIDENADSSLPIASD